MPSSKTIRHSPEGLAADHSEDAGDFNDKNLQRYRAVIFVSTTGEVLDATQHAAMESEC